MVEDEGRIYQMLSLLFRYPEEWLTDLDDDSENMVLNELASIKNDNIAALLQEFIRTIQQNKQEIVLEDYVQTFDFNEQTNLYLTSYLIQDKQERGRILVELKEFYTGAKVFMNVQELPDYLPLILEFCFLKPEYGRKILKQFECTLKKLTGNLAKINSPYVLLMKVLFLLMEES